MRTQMAADDERPFLGKTGEGAKMSQVLTGLPLPCLKVCNPLIGWATRKCSHADSFFCRLAGLTTSSSYSFSPFP